MDAKYLAEIKAREQAATSGPWKVGISALITDGNGQALFFGEGAKGNAAFIVNARTDIPALVAEVERLREENAIKSEFLMGKNKHIIRQNTQIATLKQALELAVESSQNAFIQLANAGVLTIKHIGSVKENFEYWIQQAQEK